MAVRMGEPSADCSDVMLSGWPGGSAPLGSFDHRFHSGFERPLRAGTKGRVLFVDDEPKVRQCIERLLREKGYEVQLASSGAEASGRLESEAFDVVLTDIGMPGLSGVELLQTLREGHLDIPVILVTGAPSATTAMKAIEFGASCYLTKPLEGAKLEQALDHAIRAHERTRVRDLAVRVVTDIEHVREKHQLRQSFQRALQSMWLAFQPIVCASSVSVYAYEALLRGREPSMRSPAEILRAAADLGAMHEVGRSVRRLAARVLTEASTLRLFVNIHPSDLLDEDLFDENSPLAKVADRVVLEITEAASLEHVANVSDQIRALRTMGFQIALDDLGSGYSNLSRLALVEPDVVKLDMSLTTNIETSPVKQRLVRAIVAMCRDLSTLLVAEGVETVEERDTLVSLGCDLLQGHCFARPDEAFPITVWRSRHRD